VKILLLLVLSALGIWYNWRATRHWWQAQRTRLPKSSDVFGWVGVGFSALWYVFVFVFFLGLTVNNTLLR
jgi:hypothetical protein